jgi:AbrB family looped-hinge helix DNA binding protein
VSVEVDKYGRIVLPKRLRQKYGMHEGIRLIVTKYMGRICLVPVETHKKPAEVLYGSVNPLKPIDEPKQLAREYIHKKLVEALRVHEEEVSEEEKKKLCAARKEIAKGQKISLDALLKELF